MVYDGVGYQLMEKDGYSIGLHRQPILQMRTHSHVFTPCAAVNTVLKPEPRGIPRGAPWWGSCLGRQYTCTPLLTLLGGDAGVLLALCPPVRHGLEAAGAYGMASLQGTHIILGCGTDRISGRHIPGHRQKEQVRPPSRGVYGKHTRNSATRKPRENSDLFS